MRRRAAGALLAVTVGLLPGCGAATGPRPATGPAAAGAGRGGCAAPFRPGVAARPGRPAWIIAAGALPRLRQAGLPARLFRWYFDRPAALVLVSRSRRDALVPRASPALDFTSAAALVRAMSRGMAGPAVR